MKKFLTFFAIVAMFGVAMSFFSASTCLEADVVEEAGPIYIGPSPTLIADGGEYLLLVPNVESDINTVLHMTCDKDYSPAYVDVGNSYVEVIPNLETVVLIPASEENVYIGVSVHAFPWSDSITGLAWAWVDYSTSAGVVSMKMKRNVLGADRVSGE